MHLLRNNFRYASKRDWAEVAKDLKPVYTAASEAAASPILDRSRSHVRDRSVDLGHPAGPHEVRHLGGFRAAHGTAPSRGVVL
jgi:hypothetical protein